MWKGAWRRRNCLKTRETSGFTLVEVMIAMGIIAFTAVVALICLGRLKETVATEFHAPKEGGDSYANH